MITIEVEVFENRTDDLVFEDLCHKVTDHGHGAMNDRYREHAPTSKVHATGHVSVGETISGPLYTSMKVTVSGTMPCKQSALGEVQDLLFEDCLEKVDSYIKPTYLALLAKLKETRPLELKKWQEELNDG